MCCESKGSEMTRRQFLFLTAAAGATAVAGCDTPEDGGGQERVLNAGPVVGYSVDGVHDRFRNLGFFVVRPNGQLIALSSFCTHRKCKLEAESDRSFYCPCHGSTFAPAGHVTS